MLTRTTRLITLALALATLAGCGPGAPTPPPAAQNTQPTARPTPTRKPRPTAKPSPTSAPTATPDGQQVAQIIQAALDKSKAAKSYRFELTTATTGAALPDPPSGGQLPDHTIVSGEFSNGALHTTTRSSNSPQSLSEIILVGGSIYILDTASGADKQATWYIMPKQTPAADISDENLTPLYLLLGDLDLPKSVCKY